MLSSVVQPPPLSFLSQWKWEIAFSFHCSSVSIPGAGPSNTRDSNPTTRFGSIDNHEASQKLSSVWFPMPTTTWMRLNWTVWFGYVWLMFLAACYCHAYSPNLRTTLNRTRRTREEAESSMAGLSGQLGCDTHSVRVIGSKPGPLGKIQVKNSLTFVRELKRYTTEINVTSNLSLQGKWPPSSSRMRFSFPRPISRSRGDLKGS